MVWWLIYTWIKEKKKLYTIIQTSIIMYNIIIRITRIWYDDRYYIIPNRILGSNCYAVRLFLFFPLVLPLHKDCCWWLRNLFFPLCALAGERLVNRNCVYTRTWHIRGITQGFSWERKKTKHGVAMKIISRKANNTLLEIISIYSPNQPLIRSYLNVITFS